MHRWPIKMVKNCILWKVFIFSHTFRFLLLTVPANFMSLAKQVRPKLKKCIKLSKVCNFSPFLWATCAIIIAYFWLFHLFGRGFDAWNYELKLRIPHCLIKLAEVCNFHCTAQQGLTYPGWRTGTKKLRGCAFYGKLFTFLLHYQTTLINYSPKLNF